SSTTSATGISKTRAEITRPRLQTSNTLRAQQGGNQKTGYFGFKQYLGGVTRPRPGPRPFLRCSYLSVHWIRRSPCIPGTPGTRHLRRGLQFGREDVCKAGLHFGDERTALSS